MRVRPWAGFRRHPDDRAIFALAIPALGALAADPLYSLADTAFVGHLGTPQLGALAIGAAAFTASFWLFSFLAYGVTARVARALGAGDAPAAGRIGVQALLLAALLGVTVSIAGLTFADPIVRALGASGRVAAFAEPYLRVRILAAAPVLIALVGHGWLRGAQDTRTPTVIALTGAVFHIALEYVLIYPVGMGVAGAAWATLVGQSGAAVAFVVVLIRRFEAPAWRWHRPTVTALLTIGIELALRTGSLLAGLTFATAVAARMGSVALGSWQIAMEIFLLLALSLDSVAIAAQALIGWRLGQGDAAGATSLSERLMWWGVLCGLGLGALMVPLSGPLALVFTDDPAVARSAAHLLLWIALLQPLAAAAFTLDGVLIGASDTRFLAWSMTVSSAAFVGLAYIALDNGWGTAGLAAGATVWMVARATTTGLRWRRGRWVTAG
jgi:putative MATE family efflux protein